MKKTFAILLTLLLMSAVCSGCQPAANESTTAPEQSDRGDAAAAEATERAESDDVDAAIDRDAEADGLPAEDVSQPAPESAEPETTTHAADPAGDDTVWTIQTEYFSVQAPVRWKDICTYEEGDMSVSFTHKKSYEDGCGGHLFTIRLFSVEDATPYDIPETEVLGGVGIPGLGEYNVWKICPSDVQFSDAGSAEYSQCFQAIPEIVSTISFGDGCYYSSTPFQTAFDRTGLDQTWDYTEDAPLDSQPAAATLSDGTLEYQALVYLHQIAAEFESAQQNDGYITFSASPTLFTSIVDRTEDTISIQGEINYWYNGGDPDGTIIVTVLVDRYSGNFITYYRN